MFARQDGTPIAPNTITQGFNEIVAELGLNRARESGDSSRQNDAGPVNTGPYGAALGNRTLDLLITSETLCRLS